MRVKRGEKCLQRAARGGDEKDFFKEKRWNKVVTKKNTRPARDDELHTYKSKGCTSEHRKNLERVKPSGNFNLFSRKRIRNHKRVGAKKKLK